MQHGLELFAKNPGNSVFSQLCFRLQKTVFPLNTAVLGTGENRWYSEMAVLGGSITF